MRSTLPLLATLLFLPLATAQPPAPDTIVFINGDKLVGHFVSSTSANVTFRSDVLGNITIDWSKVRELRTAQKVAVIRKGVKLGRHPDTGSIPQGTLTVENQTLKVAAPPRPPQSIPVADSSVVIDQPSFEKAVTHHPAFLADWNGAITLGATIVQATQNNRTFNGAISLVRTEPAETWLSPRDRTIFDFFTSYGELSQPNTPTIKTSIYHADAERDEYFVDSIFAFGQASFDHNFSQGLDLQQAYGGGIGWTAIQTSSQTLDLKSSIGYIRQKFTTPPNHNLIGSVFAEHYRRGFRHGLVLEQHLSYTPAWNELSAYSAYFDTLLTLPVYRRLSASTGFIDTFLNDPPPGFKKNSLQYTLGLTYTLR